MEFALNITQQMAYDIDNLQLHSKSRSVDRSDLWRFACMGRPYVLHASSCCNCARASSKLHVNPMGGQHTDTNAIGPMVSHHATKIFMAHMHVHIGNHDPTSHVPTCGRKSGTCTTK